MGFVGGRVPEVVRIGRVGLSGNVAAGAPSLNWWVFEGNCWRFTRWSLGGQLARRRCALLPVCLLWWRIGSIGLIRWFWWFLIEIGFDSCWSDGSGWFFEILWDSLRFFEILWTIVQFFGNSLKILEDFLRFFEISWIFFAIFWK